MIKKIIHIFKKEYKILRQIIRERTYVGKHLEQDIVNQFHKFYYHAGSIGKAWKDTYFLGVPIRKCPMDIWLYQEILYKTKPDLIIECGTSHGGSALFLATLMDLYKSGEVISIDILNLPRPVHPRITYLLGSSVSNEIIQIVKEKSKGKDKVMVILDSDHSKSHVLKELEYYRDFVSKGQYLIVEDTNINGHPVAPNFGPGPMEALDEFLKTNKDFTVDDIWKTFYLTFNPKGYLRKL